MEHHGIYLLVNTLNQLSKFRKKTELKKMMTDVERITLLVKSN